VGLSNIHVESSKRVPLVSVYSADRPLPYRRVSLLSEHIPYINYPFIPYRNPAFPTVNKALNAGCSGVHTRHTDTV